MRPDIKSKLAHAYQSAFDNAENAVERDRLYKSAENLGIKLQYLNDTFNKLLNALL